MAAAMTAADEGAQARYDEMLGRLRERPEDAVAEIARAEGRVGSRDFAGRWALIHTASALRHDAALPYLRSVVATPIPPEESADAHSFSTVTEETILRTTAVEGIEHLAVEGSGQAVEALFLALEQPSLSMRRAAVQALLATPGGERHRSRLMELLPEGQRFLLDVRRVDVRDVPQVRDPRAHLAEGAGAEPSPPHPLLPEDRDDHGGTNGSDAPRLRPS
ncbi:hypothetical protein [Streptomyces sp. NBC_00576]|uniref:hypothetical protein n=1 Tax=Streptomyces sp. NBC_00576 TaxID=2903665 RepID=UPI002E81AF1D|nr:hypothetical protein [Streptomyces sp. NBC_00576]WUB70038.1 hypothetical protein OG734_08110 [Streptomyces sp. NBC_00576]